uniref:DnaJ homolog subfamily B member 13 n=1 Tax=Nothobranchius kadleci TaxID=1051664 RepID=A0A1A8CE32_NOTKA
MINGYYDTLEINRNATDAEINQAYRRLAPKFHPSRNSQPGSVERFAQLGEAYDVLSDARKKAIYDHFGEEGLKDGAPAEFCTDGAWTPKYAYHGNPEQTFRQFFGGDNPFADFLTIESPLQLCGLHPEVVKVQDSPIERDIFLSLDDLYLGCIKKIQLSRMVINEDGQSSEIQEKILTIEVKRGWKEGTRIIFPKEGDQGLNRVPADIVFTVRQKSHPLFVRRNNDLIYKTQISLMMALTGFSVNVPTLDGRLLSIPINDIVHPTYEKVVAGEGMPLPQDPSQRGNLVLTFDTQFPKMLSAERRHLIQKVLGTTHD